MLVRNAVGYRALPEANGRNSSVWCPPHSSTDLSASNRLSPVGWDRLMCWFKIIKSYKVLAAGQVHEVYVTHSQCGCQPKKGK